MEDEDYTLELNTIDVVMKNLIHRQRKYKQRWQTLEALKSLAEAKNALETEG